MISAVMGMTRVQGRLHHLQTFDRRQDRDGRRDHAVAEEEGRAENAQSRQQQLAAGTPGSRRRVIKAMSDKMPPSPSLSARMTSSTYLMVTMIVTDQKISETTP